MVVRPACRRAAKQGTRLAGVALRLLYRMISVRNVSKSYGRVRAVSGVSFEIPRGQVVGLLGANGAGKSTTIRMITGFLPTDEGRIEVCGHDIVEDSIRARRLIGYLPESAPAYPEMTTHGYLDFRGRLYQMDRHARRERIELVMDRCELGEMRDRRIGHLSKGYRQRVGLAAAMLHDPAVLVLDEPTNALDPRQIRHTRKLVRELARDKTVLVSSHVLPEVEQTCDRVIIMARGRVMADARPGELIERVRANAPYIAHIRGEEDAALVSVLSVPGIERVERDPPTPGRLPPPPGATAIQIVPKVGAPDLREPIAMALSSAGLTIIELRREAPGLEKLFLELIDADVEGRNAAGVGASGMGSSGIAEPKVSAKEGAAA